MASTARLIGALLLAIAFALAFTAIRPKWPMSDLELPAGSPVLLALGSYRGVPVKQCTQGNHRCW
jgi:hypothetical protein